MADPGNIEEFSIDFTEINEQVNPNKAKEIIQIGKNHPIIEWKKALQKYYDELEDNEEKVEYFNNRFKKGLKFLGKAEIILNKYPLLLSDATQEKDAKKIFEVTKQTVLKLNELNGDYEELFTLEREILCEYFDNLIKLTGITWEDEEDFIASWREW